MTSEIRHKCVDREIIHTDKFMSTKIAKKENL